MQADLLASVLDAYFAQPESNFATCVRRIVRAELQLLHPGTCTGENGEENDITIPLDTRGGSDSSPPPTATPTATTRPRRNLEPSLVAAAANTTPTKAAASPTSGTLSDVDYDDSFFCSVDLESLVAAATGRGDPLPSPILPDADGFDAAVDAPARDPAASPMTPPRAVAINYSPAVIGPAAAACVAEAEGPLPGLGLSPSTPPMGVGGLLTTSPLRSVQTSSAFSPANGALSFRPAQAAAAAATPIATTFAAAQDRLPPPPVSDISSSPKASPVTAEKSEDDNENEENEEEEDGAVEEEKEDEDEEDFGFSETLDYEEDDGEGEGANEEKEEQEGKETLIDELFPEDTQQRRRREEKESRRQWLRDFHPPGVPIPVLPPEIILNIGSFLERRMESYARFASVCQYWRSVATEGEEWERRYAQSFGGPFPRLLLDKYENSSYLNDSLMETQEGGADDGVATPAKTTIPRNKWYQAFLWTYRQHRAIVERYKRSKPTANQRRRSARQERRKRDELDRVLLDWAAKHGHPVIVRKVIRAVAQKAQPANTGVERYLLRTNPHWDSPLHMAVENGHEEVVRMLLEEGEFSVRMYKMRCRPMLMACQFGRLSIAKLLVQHGALADKKGMSRYRTAPMHEAAAKGHLELVELLLDNGCDPNMRAHSTTALADAALHNQIEVVRCLLLRGAQPKLCNTPVLHLAARNGSTEVVQLLLAHGSDATERVQIDRPYGHAITAYEAACSEEVRRVFREYSARNRRHSNRMKSRTHPTVKQELMDEYDNDEQEDDDEDEEEEEEEDDDDDNESRNDMKKNSDDEDDRLDDEADESACLDRRKRLRGRRAKAKSEDDAMTALEEEIEAATKAEPVDQKKNEDDNHLNDEEVDDGGSGGGVEEHRGKKRPAAVLLDLDGSLALDEEPDRSEQDAQPPPPDAKKKRKRVVCDDDDDAEDRPTAETATTSGRA